MSARYEAYSHRRNIACLQECLRVGVFLGSFLLEGFLVVFFLLLLLLGFFNCRTGVCCGLDRGVPFPFLSDLSMSGPWLPVFWG